MEVERVPVLGDKSVPVLEDERVPVLGDKSVPVLEGERVPVLVPPCPIESS